MLFCFNVALRTTTYLHTPILQNFAIFELRRVCIYSFVEVMVFDLWNIRLLRSNPRGQDKLFRSCCTLASWGRKLDFPSLRSLAVLSVLDLGRVNRVQVKGFDISASLCRQITT